MNYVIKLQRQKRSQTNMLIMLNVPERVRLLSEGNHNTGCFGGLLQ